MLEIKKNKLIFLDEKPIVSLLVLFFSFLVIAISPYFDIWISKLFFAKGYFIFKSNMLFNFVDKYFPYILLAICLFLFILWCIGYVRSKKWIWGVDTKAMSFLCGTMFVGPIVFVNGVFKSFWGRARPKDIIEFGGDKIFSPAMVISNQCSRDCSFVSGHTSIAFWLIALALLAPKKYRAVSIASAFVIGIFTGFTRIAQGYHFFSDVFFAAILTVYVIWIMHYYLYQQKNSGNLKFSVL